MKINKKLQTYSLIIIAELAIIGMFYGTFLDQEITGKMGDFSNIFGILFTAFGTLGSLFVGIFACVVLFFMPKHQNKYLDLGSRILGAVGFLVLNVFAIKEAIAYVEFPRMEAEADAYKALMITFICLVDLTMLLFTKRFMKKFDTKVIIPTCFMILAIIICYAASTEVIKYLACRPRPRVIEQGLIEYREWYEFHPFKAFKEGYKDCKSFVSGHSSNSACMVSVFPLVLTLGKRENKKRIQGAAIAIGALYAFVTAFSRIVAKAHFMSDVMGGILLSVILQIIIINVGDIIIKKLP